MKFTLSILLLRSVLPACKPPLPAGLSGEEYEVDAARVQESKLWIKFLKRQARVVCPVFYGIPDFPLFSQG